MHSLLPILASIVLTLLSSCSGNTIFDFNEIFKLDDADMNNVSYVPTAPDVDLPSPTLSVHAEEVTSIVQEYAVELKNLKRVHLEHAYTYYNDEGIHTVQLQFISQDIIDLCQARKLIIDIAEGTLGQLNSNPCLIPEFTNQAFYPYNLEIYINFESDFIKYIDPFYIKWIVMEDSKILYYTADVDDNDKMGWHYKKEAYDTSKNIVLYHRLAEDKYKAAHEPSRSVFGDKRYYPPTNDRPQKILE